MDAASVAVIEGTNRFRLPQSDAGYDQKTLELAHDAARPVLFTVEVDFLADDTWSEYARFTVAPGQIFRHAFAEGYSAHWIRLTAASPCRATATLIYQ